MDKRKVFKYVKTECDFGELDKGDLFSMEPANEHDMCNPHDLWIATDKAVKLNEAVEGEFSVQCIRLVPDAPLKTLDENKQGE